MGIHESQSLLWERMVRPHHDCSCHSVPAEPPWTTLLRPTLRYPIALLSALRRIATPQACDRSVTLPPAGVPEPVLQRVPPSPHEGVLPVCPRGRHCRSAVRGVERGAHALAHPRGVGRGHLPDAHHHALRDRARHHGGQGGDQRPAGGAGG
eukprot:2144567-Pyramimonas_sp.AAC.2